MAVAEYKMYKKDNTKVVPDFIGDRGHWYNPADHTFVGWIDDNPDYYIPDTIVYLTKEQFVARTMAIHDAYPLTVFNDESPGMGAAMSNEQVTAMAESWYDNFITVNTK